MSSGWTSSGPATSTANQTYWAARARRERREPHSAALTSWTAGTQRRPVDADHNSAEPVPASLCGESGREAQKRAGRRGSARDRDRRSRMPRTELRVEYLGAKHRGGEAAPEINAHIAVRQTAYCNSATQPKSGGGQAETSERRLVSSVGPTRKMPRAESEHQASSTTRPRSRPRGRARSSARHP